MLIGMNSIRAAGFVAVTLVSLAIPSTAAFASELVGKWQQTSSNAGDCPTCSILVERTPENRNLLFVSANNGWTGQVSLLADTSNVAQGYGRWKQSVGGAYAGKIFRLLLNKQGPGITMTMRVLDPNLSQPVKGTYVLADLQNRNANLYPYAAGSWGGIVRGGPGTNFRKLDSLRQEEKVTVLERTDQMMNGYPWMKILYRDGKTGYKWGGILCSMDFARSEIYQRCGTATPYPSDPDGYVSPVTEPVAYRCDNGQQLLFSLDNRAEEPLAIIRSGDRTHYLVQTISGSGTRYSNGDQEFHTKADEGVYTEYGKSTVCRTR